MLQNPQSHLYFKQYCKKHAQNSFQYICDRQQCDFHLHFECHQCRLENTATHGHECPRTQVYVQKLHQKVMADLTKQVRKKLDLFQKGLTDEVDNMRAALRVWYEPMDQTATEKQFVVTVENRSKYQLLKQAEDLKNSIIAKKLKQIGQKFRKQMQQVSTILQNQLKQYKYRTVPLQWRFDKQNCHELLNISGYKDRSVDKKAQKQKFCVALLNQPLTPMKPQLSLTINSQNQSDKYIVLGVCSKRQLCQSSFQTNLKSSLFAIYQATKSGNLNNAYSLHSSNQQMHYKETVGWNFRTGDTITLKFKIVQQEVRIQFKKGKEVFQLFVNKGEGVLWPFVALYCLGDRVSIEGV